MRWPWKAEDLEIIDGMLQQAKEIPVVLGGYYTTRHLTNAWNKVVINGVLLRDALEEADLRPSTRAENEAGRIRCALIRITKGDPFI